MKKNTSPNMWRGFFKNLEKYPVLYIGVSVVSFSSVILWRSNDFPKDLIVYLGFLFVNWVLSGTHLVFLAILFCFEYGAVEEHISTSKGLPAKRYPLVLNRLKRLLLASTSSFGILLILIFGDNEVFGSDQPFFIIQQFTLWVILLRIYHHSSSRESDSVVEASVVSVIGNWFLSTIPFLI